MPPTKTTIAPAVAASAPRLSDKASTLAAGIFALAISGELKERIPNDGKLKQITDESIRAARYFSAEIDRLDDAADENETRPKVSTRGGAPAGAPDQA